MIYAVCFAMKMKEENLLVSYQGEDIHASWSDLIAEEPRLVGENSVVLECAKQGFESTGVELNYPLVLYSKFIARREGLSRRASFFRQNIFKTNMDSYKLAILFGTESMLDQLLPKLEEISAGSHLILCRFPLPMKCIEAPKSKWRLLEEEGDGIDAAWLYQRQSLSREM